MKWDMLYNPFRYVAGWKSAFWGWLVLLPATWLGTLNNLHFDGVIDIHIGHKSEVWFYFFEVFISWFIFSSLLLAGSFLLTRTRVRVIDILGTQIMAKIPLLIVALLCLIPQFHFQISTNSIPKIDIWFILFGLLIIVTTIWIVALMYNAYVVSANIKGIKAIVSFITVLIISEILSKYLIIKILKLTL